MLSVMGTEGCLSLGFMDLGEVAEERVDGCEGGGVAGFVNADDEELMWVDVV